MFLDKMNQKESDGGPPEDDMVSSLFYDIGRICSTGGCTLTLPHIL